MKKKEILDIIDQKMQTVVIFAVIDQGLSFSSIINLIVENDKIYFFIAYGNELYNVLKKSPVISLTGYFNQTQVSMQTLFLSGKVQEISWDECHDKIKKDKIISRLYKNPKSLNILHGFEIYDYQGEYIDYGQDSIQRHYFSSSLPMIAYGYFADSQCIYCKACYRVCPQKCIDISVKPVKINIEQCLQCGKCAQICPRRAISKTEIQIE